MTTNIVKTPRDKKLWNKAKNQVTKEYGLSEGNDRFYALVNGIYQRTKGMKKTVVIKKVVKEKTYIDADIKDETEGVKDYEKQIKQLEAAGRNADANKIRHILSQEKQHKKILLGIRRTGKSDTAVSIGGGVLIKGKENNLEKLASAVHDIWCDWAKHISRRVSQTWRDRWKKLYVPYEDLPEEEKEKDREQVKKILAVQKSAVVYGRLLIKAVEGEGRWITIRGRHVFVPARKVAITIKGDEFGNNLTNEEVRKKATEYAKEHLKGKVIKNAETGFNIEIAFSGIKHVLSHSGDIRKAKLLVALPSIIKNSKYVGAEPDYKPDRHIKQIHRFYIEAKIGDDNVRVNSVVRETTNGNFFYEYRLSDIKRNLPVLNSGVVESQRPKSFRPTAGSNSSIESSETRVKKGMGSNPWVKSKTSACIINGHLLIKAIEGEGCWVTIKGKHIFISNGSGMDGPKYELGKKLTPYDTPAVIKARKEAKNIQSTHLINTPERKALRQRIVNELYGNGAKRKNRRIDIVIGPPAAGKSSVLVDPLAKKHGSLIIDADLAKEKLPEFNGGKGAGAVHEESSEIIENHGGVFEKAILNDDNIVMPIVGKGIAKIRGLRDRLSKLGYSLHLHLNDLSPEKAAQRAVKRFEEENRFVDPYYVLLEVGSKPSKNYDILKMEGGFESYEKYSNDVPKGSKPRLIERHTDMGSDKAASGRRTANGQNSRDTGQNNKGKRAKKEDEINKNASSLIDGRFLLRKNRQCFVVERGRRICL